MEPLISTFWIVQLAVLLGVILALSIIGRTSVKKWQLAGASGRPQLKKLRARLDEIIADQESDPDPSHLTRASKSVRTFLQAMEGLNVEEMRVQDLKSWADTSPLPELSGLLRSVAEVEKLSVAEGWNPEEARSKLQDLTVLSAKYVEARNKG